MQVIGAAEDVAEIEETPDATVAEKPIHRIAAILAMEEGRDEGGGDGSEEAGNERAGSAGQNDSLREEPWNGKLDGETIALKEDEEE